MFGDRLQPIPAEDEPKLIDAVEKMLATEGQFTERQTKVLRDRFGLDDGIPRTLKEIGKVLGISAELVRRTEKRAFSKLRHPTMWRPLEQFLPPRPDEF